MQDQGLTLSTEDKGQHRQLAQNSATERPVPAFSSQDPILDIDLYTHAKAQGMLCRLGLMCRVFIGGQQQRVLEMSPLAAVKWKVFSSRKFVDIMEDGKKWLAKDTKG